MAAASRALALLPRSGVAQFTVGGMAPGGLREREREEGCGGWGKKRVESCGWRERKESCGEREGEVVWGGGGGRQSYSWRVVAAARLLLAVF